MRTVELSSDAIKLDQNNVVSRTRAVTEVLGAIAAFLIGALIYRAFAPRLDIVHIELSGRGQLTEASSEIVARHGDVAKALWIDFVFIGFYGLGLWGGSRAALRVFWTRQAHKIARIAPLAAGVAVVADIAEDVFLLIATRHPSASGTLLDAASAAAVLKFSALIPAAVITVIGIVLNITRAITWSRARARWQATAGSSQGSAAGTISGRPVASAPARGASRWRDGYNVPGVNPAEIEERRTKGVETVGFCVSGGGIRSASVAMGALQTLRPRLLDARYLVSVSGGGYTAGALQQALTTAGDPPSPSTDAPGTESKVEMHETSITIQAGEQSLTMAVTERSTSMTSTVHEDSGDPDELIPEVIHDPALAFGDGSAEQDHVRRHSSYLGDTPAEMLSALGHVARGLLISLTALFAPAVLLGAAVGILYREIPLTDTCRPSGQGSACDLRIHWGAKSADVPFPTPRTGALLVIGLLVGCALLVWVVDVFWKSIQDYATPGEELRQKLGSFARSCVQASVFLAVVVLALPSLIWLAAKLFSASGTAPKLAGGGAVTTFALTYGSTLVSIGRRGQKSVGKRVAGLFKKGGDKKDATSPAAAAPPGLVQMLIVTLTLLVLSAAWLLLFGGVAAIVPRHPYADWSMLYTVAGAGLVVLVLGGLLDETELSLHPFYRRQLALAFAVRTVRYRTRAELRASRADNRAAKDSRNRASRTTVEPYSNAEWTTLSRYGKKVDGFPQVIFAAAANITGDKRTAPGLNAVSYTMSGDWVGGPDLGWLPTAYIEDLAKGLNRDLTVQAAVAISGAAFASSMGRASRWYETLFAVSGARLGSWLPNPAFVIARHDAAVAGDWTMPGLPNIRRLPYLLREVFNIHPIEERLVQVTDGGHYDNLGLVELLRRRCTEIFCIDASGDSPPTASTLAEAMRLAHDELGVVITLEDPLGLEPGKGLALDPAEPLKSLNDRLSQVPVLTAKIAYPPQSGFSEATHGRLIFAKAMLWPEMPYPLLSYAVKHDIFPHDGTGDQWFDEGKFSAYTELGRRIGDLAERAARGLPLIKQAGSKPASKNGKHAVPHSIDSWRADPSVEHLRERRW